MKKSFFISALLAIILFPSLFYILPEVERLTANNPDARFIPAMITVFSVYMVVIVGAIASSPEVLVVCLSALSAVVIVMVRLSGVNELFRQSASVVIISVLAIALSCATKPESARERKTVLFVCAAVFVAILGAMAIFLETEMISMTVLVQFGGAFGVMLAWIYHWVDGLRKEISR